MVKNQLKAGSVLSYVQMAVGVIIGLLYTPFMIRILGQSEYGLYNTVASTISMLSILSLGFNSSYIRYYSAYNKDNDKESIYKLNGLFLIVFVIIGIIAFICGMFLSDNLGLVFDKGLTSREYAVAKILMILLTVNLAVSFPMSVFANIISAHEKFVFLKSLGILKTVAGPLVTVPLLLLGLKSVGIVSVTLAISVVVDSIYVYYVFFVLKNKFFFRNFEKGIFRSILVYTSFIAINIIVDQINGNLDNFLIARFKGTIAVAVYSVGHTLYQYYMMFSTSISGVFTPRIHKIVNSQTDDIQKQNNLTELFIKVGRIQFIVLSLVATGLVFFGKNFIGFWAGDGYGDSYYVALLLVIPSSIALIQNLGIEIQRALNKHRFRSLVYLGMALLNLILTVFLVQRYGAVGAAVGTAISLIVANGLIMNIYYYKACCINIPLFWKNILRLSCGLVIPIVFGIVLVKILDLSNIGFLLLGIVLYTGVYAVSMWFLGINGYEKTLILNPLRRIIKK